LAHKILYKHENNELKSISTHQVVVATDAEVLGSTPVVTSWKLDSVTKWQKLSTINAVRSLVNLKM